MALPEYEDRMAVLLGENARLREALAFYADKDSYRNRSLDEQRQLTGKDPTVAIRSGSYLVEAPPGRALSDIEMDEHGKRARVALAPAKP